jgi:hypothetical protein
LFETTFIQGNGVHFICPPSPFREFAEPYDLPLFDKPRFNLQMSRGKNLNSQTIKEPRRVGRNIRWLVRPIIKVVIAEQTYVQHENSSVDIDSVQGIDVVAAVRFRDIAVSILLKS